MPAAAARPGRSYESRFADVENAEEASAGLQLALPRMRRLTWLALSSAALDQDVMSVVAAMPRLRHLYASTEWAVLPAGPWLRRLRWLALGHRALLASLDELAAAQALEYVSVLSVSAARTAGAAAGGSGRPLAQHSRLPCFFGRCQSCGAPGGLTPAVPAQPPPPSLCRRCAAGARLRGVLRARGRLGGAVALGGALPHAAPPGPGCAG